MNSLRRILVGVDLADARGSLTEGSLTAVRHALWLAEHTGARVDYLHSTYRDAEDGPRPPTPPEAARLDEIGVQLREQDGEWILVEERPWVAMTRRVLAKENDLVIVGKRNHSRRQDRKLGSVSLKLIRNCPAPVWVVTPGQELRHRSILAATDLSLVGDRATEYGAFLAGAAECDLFVVHAWQIPMELQLSAARLGEEETARREQEIARAARDHIHAQPPVAALGDRAHVLLACDSPSHAILAACERESPDVLVMGTISRGGIAGFVVGNTAEKLIYWLDCSLLAVKPEDFVCPLSPAVAVAAGASGDR